MQIKPGGHDAIGPQNPEMNAVLHFPWKQNCPAAQHTPLQATIVGLLQTHWPLHSAMPGGHLELSASTPVTARRPKIPPTAAATAARNAARLDTGVASFFVKSSNR